MENSDQRGSGPVSGFDLLHIPYDERWEHLKAIMVDAYLGKTGPGLAYPKLAEFMKDNHGFSAEVHQYRHRFKKRRDERGGQETNQTISERRDPPPSVEDPPLHITLQYERYTLDRTKALRKNIFSAKQGLFTILATQPSAIYLTPDGNTISENTLFIGLQFDPISLETAPPSVRSIDGVIIATTWLSGIPIHTMPDQGNKHSSSVSPAKQSFSVPFPLVFPDLKGGASWTTVPEQKSGGNTALHYEATLQVSFEIPTQPNMILPTFHTCHISRTYTLAVTVCVANTELSLEVLVQIIIDSETQTSPDALPR
ncbi:arrestin [Colletotrichum plurivorum]|uniref:Arrestin n=1 Tax=Colletotrichum plurivorum TaxID=2175906 RepID=A0A8H6KE03_9PEZI|nr:arrestin [Colletotrichum plurivorum]